MIRNNAGEDVFESTSRCLNKSERTLSQIRKSVKQSGQLVRDTSQQINESREALSRISVVGLGSLEAENKD